MTLATTIRLLTQEDGAIYQELRLESLQQNPEAFLSLYEREAALHEAAFADHLDWAYHPPYFGYYGIFVEEKLAGYVQISRNYLEKQNHVVFLNNLYIGKKFRRMGLATVLTEYVLGHLKGHEGMEKVYLSCTGKNKGAHQLYKKLGFQRFAVKRNAVKWNGEYDDEIEMVLSLR